MSEGEWAHVKDVGTSGCENKVQLSCNVGVQCVCVEWAGQGTRPGGNGINYPVNGFPPRETWVGASAAVWAGAAYVRPGHGSAYFCPPCTLGQWSTRCVQGGPVVCLAPLEAASFGGREEGRLFRLPPRSPLYLVSLPTRPIPMRVMFG